MKMRCFFIVLLFLVFTSLVGAQPISPTRVYPFIASVIAPYDTDNGFMINVPGSIDTGGFAHLYPANAVSLGVGGGYSIFQLSPISSIPISFTGLIRDTCSSNYELYETITGNSLITFHSTYSQYSPYPMLLLPNWDLSFLVIVLDCRAFGYSSCQQTSSGGKCV